MAYGNDESTERFRFDPPPLVLWQTRECGHFARPDRPAEPQCPFCADHLEARRLHWLLEHELDS